MLATDTSVRSLKLRELKFDSCLRHTKFLFSNVRIAAVC